MHPGTLNAAKSGRLKADVVVIGAGLLGVVTALLLAREGRRVMVFGQPDRRGPASDSQRNQVWWQSGLLYDLTCVSATKMRESGANLLRSVGMHPPAGRGIFGLPSAHDASKFMGRVERLKMTHQVQQIDSEEARMELSGFYQNEYFYFSVPDVPFDERRVMRRAFTLARSLGVQFFHENVRIERAEDAMHRYAIRTESFLLEANYTIIAAGAGTGRMLGDLGINHPLVVYSSPLLVVYSPAVARVPLFADLGTHFTVVRCEPSNEHPTGCTIFGNGTRRELAQRDVDSRSVLETERKELIDLLPDEVNLSKLRHKFTAGHKTEVRRVETNRNVDPWVYESADFPGLIAGIPGKATLAHYTATQIVNLVRRDAADIEYSVVPSREIDLEFDLHFDTKFDDHDDGVVQS